MTLETIRLQNFGAEVCGLDVSAEIPEALRKELYDLWIEHGLLVFRELATTVDEHLRLARCFGPLQKHPIPHILVEGNDDLIFLGTEGDSIPWSSPTAKAVANRCC